MYGPVAAFKAGVGLGKMKAALQTVTAVMLAASVVMWGLSIYRPEPPIAYTAPASVIPDTVRVGDTFSVTRHFTVESDVLVHITRQFVMGNCKSKCDVVDLDHTWNYMNAGDYNRTRSHVVPDKLQPGKWLFYVTYDFRDFFGRWHSVAMPDVYITVVK